MRSLWAAPLVNGGLGVDGRVVVGGDGGGVVADGADAGAGAGVVVVVVVVGAGAGGGTGVAVVVSAGVGVCTCFTRSILSR